MIPWKWIVSCIISLVLASAVVAAACLLTGCQSAPVRTDYACEECFDFADCMYRNNKSTDKTACALLAEACRDALKEGRTYKRFEFCNKNKFDGISENECRLMLNQK